MKPTLPLEEWFSYGTVQRLIDEAYAAGMEDAIPADVIGLVTFMQAAFTPMTPQQEEILKQLNLAVGAIRSLKPKGEA